jgi:hypothetical protein
MPGKAIVKRCGVALASAALFTGLVGTAVPAASAASAAITPLQPLQAVRDALAGVRVGSPNQRTGTTGPRVDGLTHVDSSNWGGYADDNSTGNTYTRVSASWKEPTVSCAGSDIVVFWVGIDGYSDSSVEQDGTLAYCSGATVTYTDWWEMYPTNDIQVANSISAGDQITSTVVFSGGLYKLTVTDKTHPSGSFTTTQTCQAGCSNSSGEWIAERPSSGGGLAVLPDFGTWKVTGASVTSASTKGTISSFPDDAITMKDGGPALVTVSGLSSTGKAFSAKYRG